MNYTIKYDKKVYKFLEKCDFYIAEKFAKTIKLFEKHYKPETLDIKLLKGHTHRYRLRIGKYRFLYEVKHHEIIVYFYDADTRGDIY